MAQTQSRAKIRGRAKKREILLGTAIGLGLATTLIVGILIVTVLLLVPGTVAHDFFLLSRSSASATLPLDPLYQQWLGQLQEQEVLFWTPLSLLCGGLVLGWLAPSYTSRRRALLSSAALGFGVLTVSLTFEWVAAVIQQNTLNVHEGGQQVSLTAPLDLILRQAFCVVAWTAICVLGTWLGLKLRARSRNRQSTEAPGLRTAGH